MFKFYILLIFLLSLSCNHESNNEIIDGRKFYPSSTDSATIKISNDLTSLENSYENDQINYYSELLNEKVNKVRTIKNENHFIDRFKPDSIQKSLVFFSNDSIFHLKYYFQDSIKLMNAFYNYLDINKKLKLMDTVKTTDDNELIAVNRNFIEILTYHSLSIFKNIESLPKKISVFSDQFYYVVLCQSKRTSWYQLKKGELLPLIK